MPVVQSRFGHLIEEKLLFDIDAAIGCMLWYALPVWRRAWLRLTGRKAEEQRRLAEKFTAFPAFFLESR